MMWTCIDTESANVVEFIDSWSKWRSSVKELSKSTDGTDWEFILFDENNGKCCLLIKDGTIG